MALSVEQQILIEQRITNDGKSTLVAYVLWFLFHALGAHRFYLGYIKSATAMLALSVLGIILVGSGILVLNRTQSFDIARNTLFDITVPAVFLLGFAFLCIVSIWVVVDAFLIPGMVSRQKEAMRQKLTNYYKRYRKK